MNRRGSFPEVEEGVKQYTKLHLGPNLKVCESAGKHGHLKYNTIT
jgi:hypothetical protein